MISDIPGREKLKFLRVKKRNHFHDLSTLVERLREEEIKVARKYIVAFETNATARQNKGLKLFNLLLKYPDLSEEKARRKINKEMDAESFDKMVKRLMDKLLESILLDINTNRKEAYSSLFRTKFNLRKKMMQLLILAGRGMNPKANQLLDKIIQDAKKYELYDEVLEAIREKSFQYAIQLEEDKRAECLAELQHYARCQNGLTKAKSWYYEHYALTGASGQQAAAMAILTEALSFLQTEYKETESANIGYYLYALEREFFIAVEQYQNACTTNLRLIELLTTSPAVYGRIKLAGAYLRLADAELYALRFDQAIEHATLAEEKFPSRGFNVEFAIETRVKAHFYNNQLQEAYEVCNELLLETDAETNHYHFSRRNYLKACIQFVQQDYRQSFLALQDTREIEKDKDGWNIGIRVLTIQNMVERGKFDEAERHIANLLKFVQRLDHRHTLRDRDGIIVEVLKQLERNAFDFEATHAACQDDLLALQSIEKDFRWEINTWEMVVFHHWFDCKVKGQTYQFAIPQEVEDWVHRPEELPEGYGKYAFASPATDAQDTADDGSLVPVEAPRPAGTQSGTRP